MNSISGKSFLPIDPSSPCHDLFRPFGQVICPTPDGKQWDDQDARLDLSEGIPRLYIMTLENRGLSFDRITQHRRCTQCLGAMGVADPSIPPDRLSAQDVVVCRIRGHCLIKLERGTWHAGPFFRGERMDFINLELSTTNIDDHFTVALDQTIYIGD